MIEFISKNKTTIILITALFILLLMTFFKQEKSEEVKEEDKIEVKIITQSADEVKEEKSIIAEKILVDEVNNKSLLILHKAETELQSNSNYYILKDNTKYDIEKYIDDEHHLIISVNQALNNNSILIKEKDTNKEEIRLKEQDYIKTSLILYTKENLDKYRDITRQIFLIDSRIKIIEEEIGELQKQVTYLDKKIEEFKTNQDEKNLNRFMTVREETLNSNTQKITEKQTEITAKEKLQGENAELLEAFKNIVDLH